MENRSSMDYQKEVVEPSIKNPEALGARKISPEVADFVNTQIDGFKALISVLTGREFQADKVFDDYEKRLVRDMSKLSERLKFEHEGDSVNIDWTGLSDVEKQEVFSAYTKSLGEVLEVFRKSKETNQELTTTDVNTLKFGHTLDDLKQCWDLGQQDPLLSPHDILRIFQRNVDPLKKTKEYMAAHQFAKEVGLNHFETRELFIRRGVKDYEQQVFDFREQKSKGLAAEIPEKLVAVLVLKSSEDNFDQNVILGGFVMNVARTKLGQNAEDFISEINNMETSLMGNLVADINSSETLEDANLLVDKIIDQYERLKKFPKNSERSVSRLVSVRDSRRQKVQEIIDEVA